jgi:hypothetical protein
MVQEISESLYAGDVAAGPGGLVQGLCEDQRSWRFEVAVAASDHILLGLVLFR